MACDPTGPRDIQKAVKRKRKTMNRPWRHGLHNPDLLENLWPKEEGEGGWADNLILLRDQSEIRITGYWWPYLLADSSIKLGRRGNFHESHQLTSLGDNTNVFWLCQPENASWNWPAWLWKVGSSASLNSSIGSSIKALVLLENPPFHFPFDGTDPIG